MKNQNINSFLMYVIFVLVASAFLLGFSSCNQDEIIDNISPNTPTDIDDIENVENTVQEGAWKIISFIDSGDDETYHFANFKFTFNENGVILADNGDIVYEGTWSISDSNSNDDSPDSDVDFNIFFNLSNEFEELNDDWDIISRTDNKIELIDISGGNGGTDILTFERM